MDECSDDSVDYAMDEEEEQGESKTTRNLGYKVQKELWFNRHLPYAAADPDLLDKESDKLLNEIKKNFAKALIHKEMNPGLGICAAQLMWYAKFISNVINKLHRVVPFFQLH